jgi:hypothetical protein
MNRTFRRRWRAWAPRWRQGRRVRAGWVASLASTIRKRAATLQRGVTFDDVAGIGEAMDEPPEIIDAFLRGPTATCLAADKCPTACSRSGRPGPATLSWLAPAPGAAESAFFSIERRPAAPGRGTIDDLAVMSLLGVGQTGVRRGAPPARNCMPDAPPMPRHRSDKRGHLLRTFGREIDSRRDGSIRRRGRGQM